MKFISYKVGIKILLILIFLSSTTKLNAQENSQKTNAVKPTFIVYYFHGHLRCTTCKNMEKWAKHVVDTKFKKELKQGTIKFQAINYEIEKNQHYFDYYILSNKHIILSRVESGHEEAWKELEDIWTMVQERTMFEAYIENEVKDFMKKSEATKKNQ